MYENIVIFVPKLKKMYEFLKKMLQNQILILFEKNKLEHTDINMSDIMYAKQEVTFDLHFGTGDRNVMDVE